MSLEAFFTWMGDTPWSIALHESQYVWPFTESVHVLTLALFAGSAMLLDLRLLGVGFTQFPITFFTGRLLPWTRSAFAVMVTTGLALFYAQPLTYYHSVFFRLKVILLVVAGVNVLVFHTRTQRTIAAWDTVTPPPRAARIAAIVSLAAWAGVIVSGRLVAYNWFDCTLHAQPAWVNWAADCPAPGASSPTGTAGAP